MRVERLIYSMLVLAAAVVAIMQWRRAVFFEAENTQLAARIEAMEAEATESAGAIELAKAAAERMRKQTSELMQLRNEVTQLRSGAKSADALAAENQKMKGELADLKIAAGAGTTNQNSTNNSRHFPRENWSFAGYGSPEAALVSAIWSMKEGNVQSYFESLSPQEQERIMPVWKDRAVAEVAEKHKNDVSAISGLRVLEREDVSPGEVVMNVYLEGPGRLEKIRMNQVGEDWKFGGFIREAGN